MNKVLTIRIPSELKDAFDEVCKKDALNASALIRKFIEEFVEENKKKEEVKMTTEQAKYFEERKLVRETHWMYADLRDGDGSLGGGVSHDVAIKEVIADLINKGFSEKEAIERADKASDSYR